MSQKYFRSELYSSVGQDCGLSSYWDSSGVWPCCFPPSCLLCCWLFHFCSAWLDLPARRAGRLRSEVRFWWFVMLGKLGRNIHFKYWQVSPLCFVPTVPQMDDIVSLYMSFAKTELFYKKNTAVLQYNISHYFLFWKQRNVFFIFPFNWSLSVSKFGLIESYLYLAHISIIKSL